MKARWFTYYHPRSSLIQVTRPAWIGGALRHSPTGFASRSQPVALQAGEKELEGCTWCSELGLEVLPPQFIARCSPTAARGRRWRLEEP